MFFYEGQSCPVCNKKFAENDDVVSCPECGAPHHRACWQAEGRCHYADRHGTPEQWTRPETEEQPTAEQKTAQGDAAVCPHCGKENPTFAEFCSRCGRPLKAREWSPPRTDGAASYTPFHAPAPDGSDVVPRNEVMDDEGTTAGDAALAVATNQRYYLPRFHKIYQQNRPVSWNWSAFLFPSPWLFFRKCYVAGALMLLLELTFLTMEQLLMVGPLMSLPQEVTMMEMWQLLAESMPSSAVLISWMWGLLHVFAGLFGNFMYRQSALARCRRLKEHFPADYQARLPIEGGVTPVLFMLAFAVVELTPQIIRNLYVYLTL